MKIIFLLTALSSGLMAGLFYSYSVSVNPGLKNLSDPEYLKAMQSINVAILNPVFLLCFTGLLLLFPLSCYQAYSSKLPFAHLLTAAAALYIIAVFGVTMFCNVPLNELLAGTDLSTLESEQLTALRNTFEGPWNRFHAIRTLAVILSFGLTLWFLIRQRTTA